MAVGDIISSVTAGSTFVPASGVEIILLSFMDNGALAIGITDGVSISENLLAAWNAADNQNWHNNKVGITNSIYLNTNNGFTGIQIK